MECQICCEHFNFQKRKKVECFNCNFSSCKQCIKTYLLSQNNIEAHCADCKVRWNLLFLQQKIGKSFLNYQYKQHIQNQLFQQEVSKLPQTIDIIKNYQKLLENKKRKKEHLYFLLKKKSKLKIDIDNLKKIIENQNPGPRLIPQSDSVRIDYLQGTLYIKIEYLQQINQQINILNNDIAQIMQKHKKKIYYTRCPNTDCRGFIDDSMYCQLCKTQVCQDCFSIFDQSHQCNQSDIDSAQLIRKQCRNCPQCFIPIYKIDGCDQMFCVQCKTQFDWRTGQRIVGCTFHNPHYIQYLQQLQQQQSLQGQESSSGGGLVQDQREARSQVPCQNQDNNQCFDNINSLTLYNSMLQQKQQNFIDQNIYTNIEKFFRIVSHVEDYELNNNHQLQLRQDNTDIRIQYIKKQIDVDQFKQKLQILFKRNQKISEIRQILETFVQIGKEYCYSIVQLNQKQKILQKITDMKNLLVYIANNLQNTKNLYDSKLNINVIQDILNSESIPVHESEFFIVDQAWL